MVAVLGDGRANWGAMVKVSGMRRRATGRRDSPAARTHILSRISLGSSLNR